MSAGGSLADRRDDRAVVFRVESAVDAEERGVASSRSSLINDFTCEIGIAKPTFCAFDGSAIAVLMRDDATLRVDERAAGVTGVDRGVGLDHVAEELVAARLDVAVQTGHDPARHAQTAFEREGVADRHDVVAHLHGVGVAELDAWGGWCLRPGARRGRCSARCRGPSR